MGRQRIMLMSGFLGSGKTTAMVAMARELKKRGMEIGLITNDLGSNLVDTSFVECAGVPVREISDGCLCHDVPQLDEKLQSLMSDGNPDIILFEPVGSCVDMVAHVYRDIDGNYSDVYELAPVSALVDPVRYQAIYMGRGNDDFPEQISYMFKMQLEEADLLLISKADTLDDAVIADIEQSLRENFPGREVFPISSLQDINIARWADYVLSHNSRLLPLDIDMDFIMSGAAEMGWYNWVCDLKVPENTNIRDVCLEYMGKVKEAFAKEGAEIAHAKVIARTCCKYCRVALTSTKGEPMCVGDLKDASGDVTLNVNIRAVMQAKPLSELMESRLRDVLEAHGITIEKTQVQAFVSAEEPPAPIEGWTKK